MDLQCVEERVPGPLPDGSCPRCGRRRIPYIPTCYCGERLEPEPAPFEATFSDEAPKAPRTFRVAHLSDLHLGMRTPDGLAVEVRLRTLLSALPRLEVDGLIVSGDLTKFGSIDELTHARELFDAHGFDATRRLLIPGNHDIPRGTGSGNFSEVFGEQFPVIRALAPRVWVVGIDSNVLEDRTLFERRWVPVRGRVGGEALQKIREAWREPPEGIRLMVLHHHLARLSPESRWVTLDARTFRTDQRLMTPLLDGAEVLSLAKEVGITAVMHGHKHWYSRTGYRVGSIPVFNAGSFTRMRRPCFRIFDFREGVWTHVYRVMMAT